MVVRALAQVILVVITFVNGGLIHSRAIDAWTTHYQASISPPRTGYHNLPLTGVAYRPAPSQKAGDGTINIPARAAVVYDQASTQLLYQKNATARLPIASLTKMTTALVILQHHQLDEVVTVPPLPQFSSDVTVAGLKAGQQYSVGDLISVMLVGSAADAATGLALWDSGEESRFVDKMNSLAADWQLKDTHFAGVVGLDNPNNYSSAEDLLILTKIGLSWPVFAKAVDSAKATITSRQGQVVSVTTTNELLNRPTIYGVKTGTTAAAGQCFIGLYRDTNRTLITVVLNSTDRFTETLNLLNYSTTNFTWL